MLGLAVLSAVVLMAGGRGKFNSSHVPIHEDDTQINRELVISPAAVVAAGMGRVCLAPPPSLLHLATASQTERPRRHRPRLERLPRS